MDVSPVQFDPTISEGAMGKALSASDPREMKYDLASRLYDNMRLGEAIRILEGLGNYKNSAAMLEEIRAIKAYTDDVDAKLKAEDRRKGAERAEREAALARRRRILTVGAALAAVIIGFILTR